MFPLLGDPVVADDMAVLTSADVEQTWKYVVEAVIPSAFTTQLYARHDIPVGQAVVVHVPAPPSLGLQVVASSFEGIVAPDPTQQQPENVLCRSHRFSCIRVIRSDLLSHMIGGLCCGCGDDGEKYCD